MDDAILLDYFQLKSFVVHKNNLESEYKVEFLLPNLDISVHSELFFSNDVIAINVIGEEQNVKKAIAHANTLITPKENDFFCLPMPMICIFKDITWRRIISHIFNVSVRLDDTPHTPFKLWLSGMKDNIQSAETELAKLEILATAISEPFHNKENGFKVPLPPYLLLPSKVINSYRQIQHLSVRVLNLIASWIERVYNSNDDTEDSVIILNDSASEAHLNETVELSSDLSVLESNEIEGKKPVVTLNARPSRKRQCFKKRGLLSGRGLRKKAKFKRTCYRRMRQQFRGNAMPLKFEGKNFKKETCSSNNNNNNNNAFRNNNAAGSSDSNKPKTDLEDEIILIDSDSDGEPFISMPIANRVLRPVVIDGSNVAFSHGKNAFSCEGIRLCIEYFLKRGHKNVVAFVPQYRRGTVPGGEILEKLFQSQHVVFTPSRRINGKCVSSYDDRFIVKLATENKGVILSNDNYRDLLNENDGWKKTIEERLLMYCFVGDILMIPDDPLGKNGPRIEEFLSLPEET